MSHDLRILGQALRSLREATSLSPNEIGHRLKLDPETILAYETAELELPARHLWDYLTAIDRTFVDLHFALSPEPANPRLEALLSELDSLHTSEERTHTS
jgi:transcriptional regulator with XRE-family HTH domain